MTFQERAEDILAQGCLTYSKSASQFVKGVYPTHLASASGVTVTDTDGHSYTDWMGGLGSNILDVTNNAGLPWSDEVVLAEMVRDRIPCLQKMKFLKTGSEGCAASIRIARGFTGREVVLGLGYHGHLETFISAEQPGTGCLKCQQYFKYDSLGEIADTLESPKAPAQAVAAVIIEPVQLDINVKPQLQRLRDVCTRLGVVLIFDEVITGFRTPRYCMANYLSIQPDMMVCGKAMANGHSIAIVGGRRDIMDTPGYFISSTFAGERDHILTAIDTLRVLSEEKLEQLWARGTYFQSEFNAITPKIYLKGIPTKAVWVAESEEFRALFFQEMCKAGYLVGKAWHITLAHTNDIIERTLATCREVIKKIESGAVGLEGDLPQEVFKRYAEPLVASCHACDNDMALLTAAQNYDCGRRDDCHLQYPGGQSWNWPAVCLNCYRFKDRV
jgi:glutamate-1-semialdehyde 2,1-aminomutase